MRGITRNRLTAVAIATVFYAVLGFLLAGALDFPLRLALIGLPLFGIFISSFEVFYFQAHRGRWLREMHPLKSMSIYALILVAGGIAIQHINFIAQGRVDELPSAYARYPVAIPVVLGKRGRKQRVREPPCRAQPIRTTFGYAYESSTVHGGDGAFP